MIIAEVHPAADYTLEIKTTEGGVGLFDVRPYLEYEAFTPLNQASEFQKVSNGRYFVEWECGADLSADTIEAKMKPLRESI